MNENTPTDSSKKTTGSKTKSCPNCGKVYENDQDLSFCYYDGAKLVIGDSPPQVVKQEVTSLINKKSALGHIGFEISLQNSNVASIPLELIQSTTRMLQPNPKFPAIAENVKTSFLTIPSPRPNRNFLSKRIKHSGFSGKLSAYFACYIFIIITYSLWMIKALKVYDIVIADNLFYFLGLLLFVNLLLTIILVLPIISLGYTATDVIQASKKDFQLKIEPSLFIFTLILNLIIFNFSWPLPIIVIPGEPKLRGIPPIKNVAKSIKNAIIPGFIIILGAFGIMKFIDQKWIVVDLLFEVNLQIFLLFSLSMFFLELMPFKNAIGKLIQKNSPLTFYFIFSAVFFLLISILSTLAF